ncbi:MAG: HAD family hydrolase [Desulfopila sp.]
MIDTVIFDMDGVLLDSEPIHQRVNLAYFARLGVSIPHEYYARNFVGLPLAQMLVVLKKSYRLQQSVEEMMAECSAMLLDEFRRVELTAAPGVEALLREFADRGWQLAVGSSSSPEIIALLIGRLGLNDVFQLLLSGYQVKRGKPYPDLFLRIAELLQTVPQRCLVIEDSAQGLTAAHRAGMKAVGVDNPGAQQDMRWAAITVSGFQASERQRILATLEGWATTDGSGLA